MNPPAVRPVSAPLLARWTTRSPVRAEKPVSPGLARSLTPAFQCTLTVPSKMSLRLAGADAYALA